MGTDKQSESDTPPRDNKRKLSIALLLPIASMALAVFSLYVSETARSDVARMDVIKTEYGLFHDLAQLQLQHPTMMHLFGDTEQAYDEYVATIRANVSGMSDQERAKNLLQERAVAHYLFTTYEEAFYLWQQAVLGSDRRRAEMAQDDLKYFNEAFCSNPRLLWYWDVNGGKLDRAFAPEVQDYFGENVLKGCQTGKDSLGPFGTEVHDK